MDYEMRMGTWNVRTLLRSGALKELREIVTNYDGKRVTSTIAANKTGMSSDAASQWEVAFGKL